MSRPGRRFAFVLAGHLGMTVDQLVRSMSVDEFAEWQAFYQLEPFGEDWRQTAYVCTMIGNGNGGRGVGRPYRPRDFLPVHPPSRQQSPEEMIAVFRQLAANQRKKNAQQ